MALGELKGGVAAALALWAVAVTLWVIGRYAPAASAPRAVTTGAAAMDRP